MEESEKSVEGNIPQTIEDFLLDQDTQTHFGPVIVVKTKRSILMEVPG